METQLQEAPSRETISEIVESIAGEIATKLYHKLKLLSYLPEIKEFVVTPEYLSFLQNIASYVGADPSNVNPISNLPRIEEGLRQSIE